MRFHFLSRSVCLAVLSGVLLILSFPRFDYSFLAWIALVPLLLVIQSCRMRGAFWFSFLTGAIFFGGTWWWWLSVDEIQVGNFALAVLFNALYVGGFGLLAWYFYTKSPRWALLAFPATWVLLEYLRSHLFFFAFPWGLLGYSQYSVLPVAQLSAYTGVSGVSFLIVAANGLLAELCRAYFLLSARQGFWRVLSPGASQTRSHLMAGILLFLTVTVLFGFSTHGQAPIPSRLTVALIQGNVYSFESHDPQLRKTIFQNYQELTRRAAASRPDLIAWPSSSVPGRLPYDLPFMKALSQLAKFTKSHVLVGAAGYDKIQPKKGKPQGLTNSAFLFSPEGAMVGRYNKNRLLPFGEYLPLREVVRWPSWIVSERNDTVRGDQITSFQLNQQRFVVQICWENLFADVVRQAAGQGADFLVSMTNEGFTPQHSAHYQMLAMNVFRAIENHISIVRAATTGVSALIGPTGRIIARVQDADLHDVNVEGFVVGEIPVSSQRTFYTRYGDWFIAMLTLVFLGLLGNAGFSRKSLLPHEEHP